MSNCTCYLSHNGSQDLIRDPNCSVHGDQAQALPKANNHPGSHGLAKVILDKRLDYGLRKYGVGLQPFNGRDTLQDVVEELGDALAYVAGLSYEMENLKTFNIWSEMTVRGTRLYLKCPACGSVLSLIGYCTLGEVLASAMEHSTLPCVDRPTTRA